MLIWESGCRQSICGFCVVSSRIPFCSN